MSLSKLCRTTHAYLSLFFLPMALIYAVTGACYMCGYEGKSASVRYTAALEAEPPATAEAKAALVKKVLSAKGVACPAGDGREMRNLFIVGRPTGRHAVLEPMRSGAKEATVTVNRPNLFSRLMLLHKAKGGTAFNVFGITFGIALLLMYLSGVLLFWTSPEMRKKLTLCFAGGLAATALAVLASL